MSGHDVGAIVLIVGLLIFAGHVCFVAGRDYQKNTLTRHGTKRDRRVGERRTEERRKAAP